MLLFSFHASNTIIISFLPLYLQYKELSPSEIGWVLAIGPFASIIAQPFWGYMSDKFRTVKWVLFICLIGLIVGSAIFFQMNTLISILIMGAIFYFFTTPIGALSDSLAQRRAEERKIEFGSIRSWGSIGFALSSLLIGQILTEIGVQHMVWPYLLFGAIGLIVCLRLKDVAVETKPVQLKDVGQIVKNRPFLIFTVLSLLLMIPHRMNDSYMGIYIAELGGSEGLVGWAWFSGVMMEAVVFATARFWFKKFHSMIFIIAGAAAYSLRWFLYASIEEPIYIILLQVMHGLTFGVFYIASLEYVTRLIPKFLQSTGHLVFFAVYFGVSGIAGSLAGGAILDIFQGSTLYMTMGIVSASGAIVLTIYHLQPYGKEIKVKAN